jgi:predicted Zn-dependent protease
VAIRPGDTIATLSARMAYDDDRQARFLTLNGLAATSRLARGDRVKLIVWR